ncbi:unnamed protein product [Aureobasidium mustum]|uniref:NAD dependent epimerase/dehydratase n=1 Tax=Aureobasidium mustum TaxID=2773714 RepID=A0A9N8JW99_9PEZI|nr:unnamed protein product [Aureobasidium mustum]
MEKFDEMLVKFGGRVYKPQGRRLAPTPTGPRAIDKEGGIRTKPMKVILATEAVKMAARDLPIACEALDARDSDRPFGKEEFDKWIGDFDELLEAYPDAKVVLTTRDPEKWRRSIENTVGVISKWRIWSYLALVSPECAAWCNMLDKMDIVMDGWSIEALARHNAGVRSVVPKEKLLEFKLGQDGWQELCEFIDFPKPEGEFPQVNDGSMFVAVHVLLINIWAMKALKGGVVRMAPWLLLIGSMFLARRLGYI